MSYAPLAEMQDSQGAMANMLARAAEPFAECAKRSLIAERRELGPVNGKTY